MAFGRKISVTAVHPDTQDGLNITDLYMSFDIDKTWQKAKNTATVKIYNCSSKTAEVMAKKGNVLTIEVGYADEGLLKMVFRGFVVKSFYGREEEKSTLTLMGVDDFGNSGRIGWSKDPVVSLSAIATTPSVDLYNQIITNFTCPIVWANGLTPENCLTNIYSGGFSDQQRASKILQKLLNYNDCDYTIQDGKILIFNTRLKSVFNSNLLLSLNSGLIKCESMAEVFNPNMVYDTKIKPGNKKYKITSLLFPDLVPLTNITLALPPMESNGIDDSLQVGFQIETAKLTGDNFGGTFEAVCEGHLLS